MALGTKNLWARKGDKKEDKKRKRKRKRRSRKRHPGTGGVRRRARGGVGAGYKKFMGQERR